MMMMIFLRRGEKEQRQQRIYHDEYSFLVGIREEGVVVSLLLLLLLRMRMVEMFSRKCLRFERGNITS